MAVSIAVLVFFIILAVYIVASRYKTKTAETAFRQRRDRLAALYIERANAMPALMNAARKRDPVPKAVYDRFLEARSAFAASKTDGALREAYAALDAVFTDFFAFYDGFKSPAYIKLLEDHDKLLEKIAFTQTFYTAALTELNAVRTGPWRFGASWAGYAEELFGKAVRGFRKGFASFRGMIKK